jgi:hypothetical protein
MLKNAHLVDAFWITAREADRLVGCGLFLGDEGHQEMKLLGLDYEVRYVYFQIAYAAIQCAIEQRTQVLWGGSGAYEMKQRLGFRVTGNNQAVFTSTRPLLQKLGQRVANAEKGTNL